MKQKKLIIVTGPTASGKTSIAIQLAQHYGTEIISADSRQCFRELNIGVAKPTAQELSLVRHHFINSHSIHDEVNAATFSVYAHNALEEIFSKNDVAVMAGGTGLYIKSFEEGLDDIPDIPEHVRQEIRNKYESGGINWLQDQVRVLDPEYFHSGEIRNPQRMMRALEVKMATGLSINTFQKQEKKREYPFSIQKFAIELERQRLYDNINLRVDKMMADGLEAEARSLLPFRHLNALQTVGYSELFEYFGGAYPLDTSVSKIKQHTRHYAKRQLTWFRRDQEITWVKDGEEIIEG